MTVRAMGTPTVYHSAGPLHQLRNFSTDGEVLVRVETSGLDVTVWLKPREAQELISSVGEALRVAANEARSCDGCVLCDPGRVGS